MKTPRLKHLRKLVKRLAKSGYRAPYSVLADHHFLAAFHSSKMEQSVIEHLLNGKFRLCTTTCEYAKFKEAVGEQAASIASTIQIKKCKHTDFRTLECLAEAIGASNDNCYFVAVGPQYRKIKDLHLAPVLFMRCGVLSLELGKHHLDALDEADAPRGISSREKASLERIFQ